MALHDAKTQVDHAFTRPDLRGASFENAFGGATSLLRRRYTKDLTGVDLAILGVPFDQAVTHRSGTRFGPRAIREASSLQPCDPPYGWGFDPLETLAIADTGDLAFDYARVADFPATLQAHVAAILAQGPGTVTLGGDHFITLPILRAYAERFGPMAVIQFDAHADLWEDHDLSRIDHGTFLYKAVRLGLVDPARSVQIGIRTECENDLGLNVIDAPECHRIGPAAVAERVRGIVGDAPCYLTFDIDALDPAFAPGTGTPVWGGLASWQAAAILRGLAGIDLKGGDVVEVSPPYDTTGATAIAGAHVATEIICLYGWTRRCGVTAGAPALPAPRRTTTGDGHESSVLAVAGRSGRGAGAGPVHPAGTVGPGALARRPADAARPRDPELCPRRYGHRRPAGRGCRAAGPGGAGRGRGAPGRG